MLIVQIFCSLEIISTVTFFQLLALFAFPTRLAIALSSGPCCFWLLIRFFRWKRGKSCSFYHNCAADCSKCCNYRGSIYDFFEAIYFAWNTRILAVYGKVLLYLLGKTGGNRSYSAIIFIFRILINFNWHELSKLLGFWRKHSTKSI